MNNLEIIDILPGIMLGTAAVLVMMSIAVKRNHRFTYIISAVSLLGVFYYLLIYAVNRRFTVEPLFVIDGLGIFNTGLLVVSTLAIIMISFPYFERREERKEEYYILLILATLGSSMLLISKHF